MDDCRSERQGRPHAHPSPLPRCCLTQTIARGGYFNPPRTTLPYLAASRPQSAQSKRHRDLQAAPSAYRERTNRDAV